MKLCIRLAVMAAVLVICIFSPLFSMRSGAFAYVNPPEDDYLYSLLAPAEQRFYLMMYDSCTAYMNSTTPDRGNFRIEVGDDIYNSPNLHYIEEMFYFSHPEFYFLNNKFGRVRPRSGGQYIVMYTFREFDTPAERQKFNSKLEKETAKIMKDINSYKTDIEKETAIYGYIMAHAGYPEHISPDIYHSMAGFFERGKIVCEGYTQVMTYLCSCAGIECFGVTRENVHSWNIVRIGDSWHEIDVANMDAAGKGWEKWCNKAHSTFIENDRNTKMHTYKGFTAAYPMPQTKDLGAPADESRRGAPAGESRSQ
ncbi:MAG: hypothetical protein II664_07600 [Oscillospiraceae bacterium]|nr:hypothetical protein [Oscillospiraceae bacterium]